MTPKIAQFCDEPQKIFTISSSTQNIYFSETPSPTKKNIKKILEFKFLTRKMVLAMYICNSNTPRL